MLLSVWKHKVETEAKLCLNPATTLHVCSKGKMYMVVICHDSIIMETAYFMLSSFLQYTVWPLRKLPGHYIIPQGLENFHSVELLYENS